MVERRSLRLALAQINPTVGDLPGNTRLILDWIDQAKAARADLIVFPELALTGYPPEDLVLKPSFIDQNLQYLEQVVAASRGIAVITGFVDRREDVYNAAAIAHGGELRGVYHKIHLPNYGVFDEERYFRPGRRCPIVELRGIKLGITICEDAWYGDGPMLVQARHGVEILININGSPYHRSKRETRERMIATRASDSRAYLAWVNLAGGQDELVFDGNSAMFDPEGRIIQRAPSFEESLLVVDVDPSAVLAERLHDPRLRKVTAGPLERGLAITQITLKSSSPPPPPASVIAAAKPLTGAEEVYAALLVGTRDYIHKSGFQKVVVGLSGGIDSALTAAVAADALGPNNVIGVAMPSRYTSKASEHDAAELAAALGLELIVIPIDPARRSYEEMLAGPFAGTESGLAEENIQPRIRGNLLMALCNKFGYLLLTTGNKSELATGYCTLYGDMAGGFAVLKDIPKTLVYELASHRNLTSPVIPQSTLTRPPTAELRPDQRDTDSLPPYDVLDPILQGYVEDDLSWDDLVAAGHDPEVVTQVIRLVDRSEYKRRQAPPGIKITPRAFGRDRRMPLVNRYGSDGPQTSAHEAADTSVGP